MAEQENKPTYSGGGGGGIGTIGIVLGLAGAGVGIYFLKDYLDEQKKKTVLDFQQKQNYSLSPVNVAGKKLSNWYNLKGEKITSANLASLAADLNGALHPGWYAPTEQARAVRVFLQTPYGMVKKLETVYLTMYSEDLKKTLTEKLSDVNYIKIKNYFSGKAYQFPGLHGA